LASSNLLGYFSSSSTKYSKGTKNRSIGRYHCVGDSARHYYWSRRFCYISKSSSLENHSLRVSCVLEKQGQRRRRSEPGVGQPLLCDLLKQCDVTRDVTHFCYVTAKAAQAKSANTLPNQLSKRTDSDLLNKLARSTSLPMFQPSETGSMHQHEETELLKVSEAR
uniref:Uncharacterized protein n=1 Tax=Ciona savignyi TaxID=51511 RepID=H2YXX6_CIOSA